MAADDGSQHSTHHTIRTVSLGTVWRVLRYPFILLSVSIIPRAMGDTVYGQYAFFMSVFLIFDYLTDIGSTQVFGRFVPEYEATEHRERSSHLLHGSLVYGMGLTLAVIACLLAAPLIHPFESFPPSRFVFVCLLLFFTKTEGILFGFIYGLNHIARYSSREVLRSACTFVLVLAGYLYLGLYGAFLGLVLNAVILTVIAVAWTRPYLASHWHSVSFREFKPFLFFGIKFYVPLFLFGMMMRLGNVLVQRFSFLPETEAYQQVAYYDIANQFLLLTATFLGLILSTLLPSLSALYIKGEHAKIDQYHHIAMRYCGVSVFLAYNALGWLGRDVITLIMGDSFAPVFPNAMVMVVAIFPGLLSYVGMNYSVLEKKPGIYAKAVAFGLGTMVVVSILLTPRMKALGTTWGTVAGNFAMALVFAARYRREFAVVLRRFWWIVAIGLPVVPFYRLHVSLPAGLAIYCLTSLAYVGILLALRLISWGDAKGLVEAFRQPKTAGNDAGPPPAQP
jgi:O-antigen/teichoic acid export membrane protein